MDRFNPRSWYRWHLLTWLVGGLVIWALIDRECEKEPVVGIGNLGTYTSWSTFGWPLWHLEMVQAGVMTGGLTNPITVSPSSEPTYEWRLWQLLGNVMFCLLLVAATVFVFETWRRSPKRGQFSLRSLFVLTAVLGVLAALAREWEVPYRDWESLTLNWSLIRTSDLTQPLRWALIFALGCAIYTLGWLVMRICLRAYRGMAKRLGAER